MKHKPKKYDEWIPTESQLPALTRSYQTENGDEFECSDDVLIVVYGEIFKSYMVEGNRFFCEISSGPWPKDGVTHWAPLIRTPANGGKVSEEVKDEGTTTF